MFDIGELRLRAVYTPGHTDDSKSFLLEEDGRKLLFTGDMLQGDGGIGATWFDSDHIAYRNSLLRIEQPTPDAILPGHRMFTLSIADAWIGSPPRS